MEEHTDTVILGQVSDQHIPSQECFADRALEPCTIVIFGATGDLTIRKLAPSLYNLFVTGILPDSVIIVGAARSEMSHEQFREKIRSSLGDADSAQWERFAESLYYQRVGFDSPESFAELSTALHRLEKERNPEGNRIFYLAIPPSHYAGTVEQLGSAGLSHERSGGNGWVRIVLEKPFGRDLETAVELNRVLHAHFLEQQIFRIDHYLAKETVQNVLMFRFANAIFEPLWNRMYIDHVRITAAESLGVENRARYYEESGVLRDMFQNHMMQLLALVAMEPPSRLEAECVRDEKYKVFRSLRPFAPGDATGNAILGQYLPGTIGGVRVPGYRDEPGVDRLSRTPTFATMRVFLDNWRWQGVPFYLTSGKRLADKMTEIAIYFRQVPHSMFRGMIGETVMPNVLTLGIYPEERISLGFQTKYPGGKTCLRSVRMDFDYRQNYSGPILDAYEKAIMDCMLGDHMLFWRQDGVEICWSFLQPLLEDCEDCVLKGPELLFYEAGTWGPEVGHAWRESRQ
jgi:glucose-6-phosphate 1-dehydrogenase